jgi:hypothetical protein
MCDRPVSVKMGLRTNGEGQMMQISLIFTLISAISVNQRPLFEGVKHGRGTPR